MLAMKAENHLMLLDPFNPRLCKFSLMYNVSIKLKTPSRICIVRNEYSNSKYNYFIFLLLFEHLFAKIRNSLT